MDLSPQYRDMILKLFPKGKAWNTEAGSFLYGLAWGCADELNRLHARALQLIEEADPRTSQEMLADWMRVTGIPDSCCPTTETTAQLRKEMVIRFKGGYGQSPDAFVKMAADIGFTITITPTFQPFQVGNQAGTGYAPNCKVGGALTNTSGGWAAAFQVNAPLNTLSDFEVGRNVVGDPLVQFGNQQLECKVNQMKPAHSIALFVYS